MRSRAMPESPRKVMSVRPSVRRKIKPSLKMPQAKRTRKRSSNNKANWQQPIAQRVRPTQRARKHRNNYMCYQANLLGNFPLSLELLLRRNSTHAKFGDHKTSVARSARCFNASTRPLRRCPSHRQKRPCRRRRSRSRSPFDPSEWIL